MEHYHVNIPKDFAIIRYGAAQFSRYGEIDNLTNVFNCGILCSIDRSTESGAVKASTGILRHDKRVVRAKSL